MVERLCSIRLALYGLIHERHGAVRADVFAAKLTSLVRGLRASDRHVNGAKCLDYHISILSSEVRRPIYVSLSIAHRRYLKDLVLGISGLLFSV